MFEEEGEFQGFSVVFGKAAGASPFIPTVIQKSLDGIAGDFFDKQKAA